VQRCEARRVCRHTCELLITIVTVTTFMKHGPWDANIVQVEKKFPTFYGNRRFMTVITRPSHWTLPWATWIQFTPSQPISLRFILILSSHLHIGITSDHFPSDFQQKVCMHFVLLPCALRILSIWPSLILSL
jgi:hypothetical protein